ncbi:MAG: HAD-IA family hydrolase [Candidatus Bilamarchaeum sp.]|jgi:putative hydrolase of the HAD superfamily
MVNAILFDLDNTLLDFISFKIETAKAAAKAMIQNGLPTDEITAYGKIFSVYEQKGLDYQKTFHDVVIQFNLDPNRSERIQQAAILAYLKRKPEVLHPYPLVRSTIAKLRQFCALSIVTDSPRNKTWQRLLLSGLENDFDVVITADDSKDRKPEPRPYQIAIEKLRIEPYKCLFVSDDTEKDLKGAKELGMKTAWAKYGSRKKTYKTKPDYEIEKFEDLLSIIKH